MSRWPSGASRDELGQKDVLTFCDKGTFASWEALFIANCSALFFRATPAGYNPPKQRLSRNVAAEAGEGERPASACVCVCVRLRDDA